MNNAEAARRIMYIQGYAEDIASKSGTDAEVASDISFHLGALSATLNMIIAIDINDKKTALAYADEQVKHFDGILHQLGVSGDDD